MRIRIKGKKKIDLIVAYRPQAENKVEGKEDFYDEPRKAIKATPKRNILSLAGDFNAKVLRPKTSLEKEVIGTEAVFHEHCEKGVGGGAIDNRERFINMCLENGSKIASTRFQKPIEEKVTYKPLGV